MSKLAAISSSPMMQQYAQGAAQAATAPVADFLAPPAEVPQSQGKFKYYDSKNRFYVPDSRRAIGGQATQVGWSASDKTYNCEPHALDFPVDNLEQLEHAALESTIQEGANVLAEVGALSHEKAVIDAAIGALGAGTDINASDSSVDLIDLIDQKIIKVLKAAKYGSVMGVGVLFGPEAARRIKNHPLTRNRVAGKASTSKSATGTPSIEEIMGMFIGNPEHRISWMVHDTKGPGEAEDVQFLIENQVIVFARKAVVTRRDPSFMKTFRLMGQWMVPGSYMHPDGRGESAKMDWSEDVQVTNTEAGERLNFNAS